MKAFLISLVFSLWAHTALALPPKVEADRLILLAKAALEAKAYDDAGAKLAQAQALKTSLPEDFAVTYASALSGQGKTDKARQVLEAYLNKYGTAGPSYKTALSMLVQLEGKPASSSVSTGQPSTTSATSASAANQLQDWGLANADLSMLTGADIAKKARLLERRAEILKAAQEGDKVGQYLIGLSYANGVGVQTDDAQAIGWFTKSAEQGLVRAVAIVGSWQIRGLGTAEDVIGGWTLLLKAVNAGNAYAKYDAALMTLQGIKKGSGFVQYKFLTRPQAMSELEQSAKAGLSAAQYSLGHVYMVGNEDYRQDLKLARYWLEKAAAQQHSGAIAALAKLPATN